MSTGLYVFQYHFLKFQRNLNRFHILDYIENRIFNDNIYFLWIRILLISFISNQNKTEWTDFVKLYDYTFGAVSFLANMAVITKGNQWRKDSKTKCKQNWKTWLFVSRNVDVHTNLMSEIEHKNSIGKKLISNWQNYHIFQFNSKNK